MIHLIFLIQKELPMKSNSSIKKDRSNKKYKDIHLVNATKVQKVEGNSIQITKLIGITNQES